MKKKIFLLLMLFILCASMLISCSTIPQNDDAINNGNETNNQNEDEDKQEDNSAIGGTGTIFDYYYVEPVNYIGIISRIFSLDVFNEYGDKLSKLYRTEYDEYVKLPNLYKAICEFKIAKDDLIKANNAKKKMLDELNIDYVVGEENILSDKMIELLYCGDETRMKQELVSPYAFYANDKIYRIFDLKKLSDEDIMGLDSKNRDFKDYIDRVNEYVKENKYLVPAGIEDNIARFQQLTK